MSALNGNPEVAQVHPDASDAPLAAKWQLRTLHALPDLTDKPDRSYVATELQADCWAGQPR